MNINHVLLGKDRGNALDKICRKVQSTILHLLDIGHWAQIPVAASSRTASKSKLDEQTETGTSYAFYDVIMSSMEVAFPDSTVPKADFLTITMTPISVRRFLLQFCPLSGQPIS